ncbi:hypothetical protein AGLY_017769 [Aphis glycines]|uniref:Uncharacterized protein n=1 Tax=Aphis glycines TaxID=307491 RepID=A0A6G0SV43_APHGL|nr:hypothetical protein AGLY_017769 [Aphis glycines]
MEYGYCSMYELPGHFYSIGIQILKSVRAKFQNSDKITLNLLDHNKHYKFGIVLVNSLLEPWVMLSVALNSSGKIVVASRIPQFPKHDAFYKFVCSFPNLISIQQNLKVKINCHACSLTIRTHLYYFFQYCSLFLNANNVGCGDDKHFFNTSSSSKLEIVFNIVSNIFLSFCFSCTKLSTSCITSVLFS